MISEGSGQNVFIVHRGTVYTTPLNGTLLPGITRDSIITLARDAGLEVRETPLQRDFLYAADEIFLTGTASEVTPVRSIDRLTVGEGRVGEVTRMLQRTFLDLVQGKTEDRHNWLCHVRAERASAT
jgi:branched-chain amino acid aminotransferase